MPGAKWRRPRSAPLKKGCAEVGDHRDAEHQADPAQVVAIDDFHTAEITRIEGDREHADLHLHDAGEPHAPQCSTLFGLRVLLACRAEKRVGVVAEFADMTHQLAERQLIGVQPHTRALFGQVDVHGRVRRAGAADDARSARCRQHSSHHQRRVRPVALPRLRRSRSRTGQRGRRIPRTRVLLRRYPQDRARWRHGGGSNLPGRCR
jgi:hypothetical protein